MIDYCGLFICCFICCVRSIQCCCKTSESRKMTAIGFFIFSLLMIGLIFFSISKLNGQRQENQQLDPLVNSCIEMCSNTYSFEKTDGICCSGDDCKSKIQCQDQWQNFYITILVFAKVIVGLFIFYAAIFLVGCITQLFWKPPAGVPGDRQEQRLGAPFIQNGEVAINADSMAQDRLRESIIVRDSQSICSICLQVYMEDKAVVLDCSHMFHSNCIRDWIKLHNTCPLCRVAL